MKEWLGWDQVMKFYSLKNADLIPGMLNHQQNESVGNRIHLVLKNHGFLIITNNYSVLDSNVSK